MHRFGVALALTLLLGQAASAQRAQATMSGTIQSMNTATGIIVIRMDSGVLKTAHMVPTGRWATGDPPRFVSSAAFPVGKKVAIRLCGPINESPVQIDLVSDWFSSKQYVATAAPAPYMTRMGDFPTTGGVGGSPQNGLQIQRPDKTIGILGNGGKFDPATMGPPGNQGGKTSLPNQMINGGGMPGMGDMTMPGGGAASSLMGVDGEDGPGTGGPQGGTGVPVQMQAQVLRADPGSRQIQVTAVGSQQPQNVILGAQVQVPLLQPGTLVQIMGQTNPAGGYIEATSIIPMNQMNQAPPPSR